MKEKPLFTVVCIAKNEEKTLPRLIESLDEFQKRKGEIIILDTGSTDDTVSIAIKLGCKVVSVGDKFKVSIDKELADKINQRFITQDEGDCVQEGDTLFNFSEARNYAASLSQTEMVAMPDCDEIYSKLDIDRINEDIRNGITQFEYHFVFAHDENNRPLVEFIHSKFYNRNKLKWVGVIHEVLSGESNRKYTTDIKLEHYQNPETNRGGYLKGLAYDCFLNLENDRNSHYFARELMYYRKYESAIQEFKRHISLNAWKTEAAQSMIFIGNCLMELGKDKEAITWYTKSFDLEPNRREPLMRLAEYYYKQKKEMQAMVYAEAALKVKGISFYANYRPFYEEYPHEILYWAYWWLGDREESKKHYLECIKYCPDNPKYLEDKQYYFTESKEKPSSQFISKIQYHINNGTNISFIKKGDGEELCMNGVPGENCDGAKYSKSLGDKLREAYKYFKTNDKAIVIDYKQSQLDVNALLHRDDSDINKVKEFYLSIRNSNRPKYYFCPDRLKIACELLKAEHIPISLKEFSNHIDQLDFVFEDNSIILVSGGMGAKVLIAKLLNINPNITCLDIGSSFDPFILPTRTHQLSKQEIFKLYKDELPLISILLPTLGREEGLKKCIQSLDNQWYKNIEILIDNNPEDTVPIKVNKLAKQAKGEYLVFAANDTEFYPDTICNAYIESLEYNKGLVSFNEGELLPDKGNINTHFLLSRNTYNQLGEIFDERFNHVGVDNLLWERVSKLNQTYHSQQARIIHNHFSKTGEMDEIYTKGWAKVKEDRQLLESEIAKLGNLKISS